MPFPGASQALSHFTLRDLTPGPLRADLRAAAGEVGAKAMKMETLMEGATGEQPGGPLCSDFQDLHCKSAVIANGHSDL